MDKFNQKQLHSVLTHFLDDLRSYVDESNANLAHDERDSKEFVDIFIKNHPRYQPTEVSLEELEEVIKYHSCSQLYIEKYPNDTYKVMEGIKDLAKAIKAKLTKED